MLIELIAAGAGLVSVPAIGWWALRDYSPPIAAAYAAMLDVVGSVPAPSVPIPAPEAWSREDARRAAELYRQVPSAFWLAPEYTRYDGPELPQPKSALRHVTKRFAGATWEGRPIHDGWWDPQTMTYRLQLEGGDWVQMTEQMMLDNDRWRI